MWLAGTAGQLHNYHLPEPAFVFDVVPETTMPSLSSSLSSPRKVLITKGNYHLYSSRCFPNGVLRSQGGSHRVLRRT